MPPSDNLFAANEEFMAVERHPVNVMLKKQIGFSVRIIADGFLDYLKGQPSGERFWLLFLQAGLICYLLSLFSPLSNKAVNNCYYVGVLLPSLVLAVRDGKWPPVIMPLNVFLTAYVLFATSMWLSVARFDELAKSAYVFGLFFACAKLLHHRRISAEGMAIWLSAGVMVYTLMHWVVIWVGNGYVIPVRPHFYGWQLFVPTYVTAYMAVAFSVVLAIFVTRRCFFGAVMLLAAFLIVSIALQSRMGLVGLLVSLPVLALSTLSGPAWVRLRKAVFLSVAVTVAAGGLHFAGVLSPLYERGGSFRPEIWLQVWLDYLHCNALIGCGYEHSFEVVLSSGEKHVTPHSAYFGHLLHLGAVGLFLLLALILAAVSHGLKSRSIWLYGFVTGCGTLLVEGWLLLDSPRGISYFLFWFPLAMMIAESLRKLPAVNLVSDISQPPETSADR